MNEYQGVSVRLHTLLTSALDGGERLTSCPRHFNSGKKNPVLTD